MYIIRNNKTQDVRNDYIDECYRRMYAEAVKYDGTYGDYDALYYDTVYVRHSKDFPYDDYYLPPGRFYQIIEEVCNMKYKHSMNAATVYQLKPYMKRSISMSITLGISPISTADGFLKRHPSARFLFTDAEIEADRNYYRLKSYRQ